MVEGRLQFENHAVILLEKFQNFREHEEFADVTLICSNSKRIKAHKIVLAACSPFFENTIKEENSPVFFFADITEQEMEAILEFIYTGSLNISRTFIPNLLRAARCLQIRGLERYNSEVNQLTRSPPQQGTPSPPSPVIKRDGTPKVINPFSLRRRRNAEDSDSTCSEDELYSNAKIPKCEKQDRRFIRNPTSMSKDDDDSDVEFVEENSSVVVVNDTQKPESPPWFQKSVPKNKRHGKSKRYAMNKEKDSSEAEISTVEKNVTDSGSEELVPQASTSESQTTTKETTVQKTEKKPNDALTEEELLEQRFDDLTYYCVLCNSFRTNIMRHMNCLHIKPLKRKKFTCEVCSKKFFMKYGLKNHTCNT